MMLITLISLVFSIYIASDMVTSLLRGKENQAQVISTYLMKILITHF